MLCDVTVFSACATVLEGDVADVKRGAPVQLRKKKIEEAVQENLGWSGENQLAEVGELEAERRRRSIRLSQKLIAVPRLRSAETRTRRARRRSRARIVRRNRPGRRRVDVAHLSTRGVERATIVKLYKCWVCSWRQLR